jgi:hypothetical protein
MEVEDEMDTLTDEDLINIACTRHPKFEAHKAWRIEKVFVLD